MTIDERIVSLMQSIESHDRQIGELVERVDRTTANIDALGASVDRMAETTQLNFDRLTKAMMRFDGTRRGSPATIERLEQ